MAFDNTVTIVGNVTRDPELRYLTSGTALAQFGIAYNRRYTKNGEQVEDTSFFDVVCWSNLADNVSESVTKGDRVIVYGRLEQRSWETQEGDKRSKVEIIADEVGPSLRWATASVTRTERKGPGEGGGGGQGGGPSTRPVANSAPDYGYDEEPF